MKREPVKYKGLHIVKVDEWYPGRYMIQDGYDYFQVPPFRTVKEAKAYIDAGGKGVSGEKIPGWENRA
jgi:hypothetical protein